MVCFICLSSMGIVIEKSGRQFTDLNGTQAEVLLNQFEKVKQLKQWITIDQRPNRSEKWLNLIWKKHA